MTSHAKFGVASTLDPSEAWVVGGDENNQGFGCSTTCEGSQNGEEAREFWRLPPLPHFAPLA